MLGHLVNTDYKSHLWVINVALIFPAGTASVAVIISFMCTYAHTCTRQWQHAASTFMSWSITYIWHCLNCSKRLKSNLNTLRLVWSLADRSACTRKPVSSLDNNWVERSRCDEEIKMIIVSLLKLALKALFENAVRLVSLLTKDCEYGAGSDNWKKAAVMHSTEIKLRHC